MRLDNIFVILGALAVVGILLVNYLWYEQARQARVERWGDEVGTPAPGK